MKLTTLIITILFPFFINAQNRYLDINDNEISEYQFLNQDLNPGEFRVYSDSLKTGKIMPSTTEIGTLNGSKLYNLINANLNLNLEENKPLVIIYYPGKDPFISRAPTIGSRYQWNNEVIRKSNKITPTNFLFIYKTEEGLKHVKKNSWHKDPKGLIEKSFFKYNYPCCSYVIIFNNKYTSHFGEFSQEGLLEDLQQITK